MEITDARYTELLWAEARVKTLEADLKAAETESSNKAKALKEERDARKNAEDSLKVKDTEIEALNTAHTTELEKFKDFETISEKAKKFDTAEAEKIKKRTDNIESLKTTLWKDFLESEKDFIDGLPEDKLETYLTKAAEAKWKKKVEIKSWVDTTTKTWGESSTDFETHKNNWNLEGMLASIPLPWQLGSK